MNLLDSSLIQTKNDFTSLDKSDIPEMNKKFCQFAQLS